jgi:Na+/melibiose symporter-like transporter
MTNSAKETETYISPVAEKCGRIAFWFYGAVIIIIGGLAAYLVPMGQAVLASAVIVWGITIVILGYMLPPKLVAFLGILLPW